MDHFIWISGSINSGKTTIAKLLSNSVSNAVNIDLDVLCHFDDKMKLDDKANFIIKDGLDLAKNWIDRNCFPVLNWPLWGAQAAFMLSYATELNLEPIMINLVPDLAIVKQNRGGRALTEWELERIDYMYNCGIDKPGLGMIIDNGHLTATATVEKIITELKAINLLQFT